MRIEELYNVGSLPQGEYFLGDPSYVIAPSDWMHFSNSLIGGNPDINPIQDGRVFAFKGLACFVTSTNHGAGEYVDNVGNVYTCFEGIIGMIPFALCTKRTMETKFDGLGHKYEAHSWPIEIWVTPGRNLMSGKRIHIGARVIST